MLVRATTETSITTGRLVRRSMPRKPRGSMSGCASGALRASDRARRECTQEAASNSLRLPRPVPSWLPSAEKVGDGDQRVRLDALADRLAVEVQCDGSRHFGKILE